MQENNKFWGVTAKDVFIIITMIVSMSASYYGIKQEVAIIKVQMIEIKKDLNKSNEGSFDMLRRLAEAEKDIAVLKIRLDK